MPPSSLLGLLAALSLLWTVSAAPYTNPIISTNIQDPFITFYQGYYYFMRSSDSNSLNQDMLITRATTLEGLKRGQTKSLLGPTASAALYTGPELHMIDGIWWIYYCQFNAEWKTNTYESLAVLKGGPSVRDPFTYVTQLTNTTLSHSPTILRFPNQLYMVYSCRASPVDQDVTSSICIAPMLSPTSLGPTKVLINATEPWEILESEIRYYLTSPAVLYHAGKTFITYSLFINHGQPFGLVTYKGSGDPMSASSWIKTGPHQNVAFYPKPNTTCYAGDNKFFLSPDESEIWNVYSAGDSSVECRGYMHTGAKMIGWNADGSPDFTTPALLNERKMGPSGE